MTSPRSTSSASSPAARTSSSPSSVVDVDLDGDQTADLIDANLLTFGVSELRFQVGTDDFGVAITSGAVQIASLAPAPPAAGSPPPPMPDTRKWLAVQASGLGASLNVGSLLTAELENVSLQVNQASPAVPTPTPVLDWTAAFDIDANGVFGEVDDLLIVDGTPIELTTDKLAVAGDLATLSIAGLVNGSAHFEITKQTVDVNLDDDPLTAELEAATLITIGLSEIELSIGTADFGVAITGGAIQVAALAPKPPTITAPGTPAPSDARRWLAVQASGIGASLNAGDLLSAALEDVALEINQASGGLDADGATGPVLPELAVALDWTAAFDFDGDGTFGEVPEEGETDTLDLLVVDGTPITLVDDRLAVSGTLANLSIAGIITGSASFELVKSTVSIDLPDPALDVASASMLTLAITDLNLMIGDPEGVNFEIAGGSLVLATVKPIAPTLPARDTRSWLALTGGLEARRSTACPRASCSSSRASASRSTARAASMTPTPRRAASPTRSRSTGRR